MATGHKLVVDLSDELHADLEGIARKVGRDPTDLVREAIVDLIEDHLDYAQAVEALERDRGQPGITLDEMKRDLGLAD